MTLIAPTASKAAAAVAPAMAGAQAKPARAAVRLFGPYQLLRLLGKSELTMAWSAVDTRSQQECLLVMPRKQPDQLAGQRWHQQVRRASRLSHPNLGQMLESGEHDRWPFVAYDLNDSVSWADRFSRQGVVGAELAAWAAQAAQGLAFAHEAGFAHRDLQPWLLIIDGNQQVRVMGLEVAGRPDAVGVDTGGLGGTSMAELHAVRHDSELDVLALGLIMHHALVGQAALDEPDVAGVIRRIPPQGAEFVRLPWSLPRPIPDPLRAIVNRATDRQTRQRYRNARTLQRALEGWLKTLASKDGGPLGLLLDRLRSIGVLPAQPGGAERVAHLALMEQCRTSELADLVLSDLALTFELLRTVNSPQGHGARLAADGPVLMLRRAIAMLGLEGVRRAALSLRAWPGPMSEAAAQEMEALIRRVHRAARIAVRLAPAGYDGEVIYLVTMLQNLGRLVVQYHFPDEAAQIRKLMQPEESPVGAPEDVGMSSVAASFAVLGADTDELGLAVAHYWGLDESVLHMIRRPSPTAAIHTPEADNDILRCSASCANELVDAISLPATKVQAALRAVVQRYGRALNLSGREIQEVLQVELQLAATTKTPSAQASQASGRSR